MQFPFKLNTEDEFDLVLAGKKLRFRANYPHTFPDAISLEEHVAKARLGQYDGLTVLEERDGSEPVSVATETSTYPEPMPDIDLHRFCDDGGAVIAPAAISIAASKVPTPDKPASLFRRIFGPKTRTSHQTLE